MPSNKMKPVTLLLSKLVTDRNQYKPYMAELASPLEAPVYVRVYIPEDEIISDEDEPTIITVDGLSAVLNRVATSIDEMHEAYKQSLMKK